MWGSLQVRDLKFEARQSQEQHGVGAYALTELDET